MKGLSLTLVLATMLGFSTAMTSARAGAPAEDSEFPYVILAELGASEFASRDGIIISSVRGNRKHLEVGGHYVLDGSYTLTSAESADLAWFSTSRGPSASTPVNEEEHLIVGRGFGKFHLEKTLVNDGWLHVSFYINGHSHGGVYFGEEGLDRTVLRQKGWSDFSSGPVPENAGLKSPPTANGGLSTSHPSNAAIMAYLGNPVAPPGSLDSKYTPTNLVAAFTALSKKSGWRIQRLAVDDSEFPFLLYGVLAGGHELIEKDIRAMNGYDYGGSVRGSTVNGSTYFSLNMIPHDQYPSDRVAACNRRLMVRLQMLAEAVGQSQ